MGKQLMIFSLGSWFACFERFTFSAYAALYNVQVDGYNTNLPSEASHSFSRIIFRSAFFVNKHRNTDINNTAANVQQQTHPHWTLHERLVSQELLFRFRNHCVQLFYGIYQPLPGLYIFTTAIL